MARTSTTATRAGAALLALLALCVSTAAARPIPLKLAAAADGTPVSRQLQEAGDQAAAATQMQAAEAAVQYQAALMQQQQQQQLSAVAGMPVPRLLRWVPTDVSSRLAMNDAKGAIMMAVDSGSPDATMWAANRNAADSWMVANGGSYGYAGLAGPRGAGGLYNPFAY
ncbi:MAG: hypothetical protein J3K34DRAFT_476607 [Monoraphidium minutum]|nr:MAG: hypothetical protein J3K34DRAFT_476607 [Monoraphidium minutum]